MDEQEKQQKIITSVCFASDFRKKLRKLFMHNADLIWWWEEATASDFYQVGLGDKEYRLFCDIRKKGFAEDSYKKIIVEKIKIITISDASYPKMLREIPDYPPVLFVRGEIPYGLTLGMVGSRKATRYGSSVATIFSEKLSSCGVIIASGLAMGIDAISHKGAVSLGGKTIAVLGSGIDDNSIYPQTNYSLVHKILEKGGAIISEYPPGSQIYKMNFVERNRIIAGLSKGVIIVEAAKKSGALITADFALSYGRDVFAVPGDITRPESEGTNNLIKEGAISATNYEEILSEYGIKSEEAKDIKTDSREEELILEALFSEPLYIDDISKKTGLSVAETSATLSVMEIKGIIINQGGQTFAIKK